MSVWGRLSHKPTLGHEVGSSAGSQKQGGWWGYEETGRGRASSGCLDGVAECGLSSPPARPLAPLQPPHSSPPGSESAEEFGGINGPVILPAGAEN